MSETETYPGLISVTEAVKLSNYNRPYIYNLLSRGKLKGKKIWSRIGPLILIDKQSLLDYCKEQERPVDGHAS